MFRLIRKLFIKFDKSVCYFRGLLMFGKLIYVEKNVTVRGYENIEIGKKCKIFQGSIIDASRGKIVFKNNVTICVNSIVNSAGGFIEIDIGTTIGDFCNLYGQGGLTIEKDVMVASCVQIVPNSHTYKDVTKAIKFQDEESKGITIRNGCWIGTNVAILDDVIIGKNTVIGAGSIVNKSIPEYCVAAGVPVRIIKQYNFEKQEWVNA
ncbi:MAG: acyltransferase [Epsilonproteobacteria bacterium]|nr:acyltransferase [Campylobacterota bacterium]